MAKPEDLDPRSRQILQEAGFTWDRELGLWVNAAAGQAISMGAATSNGPEWLAAWVRNPTRPGS